MVHVYLHAVANVLNTATVSHLRKLCEFWRVFTASGDFTVTSDGKIIAFVDGKSLAQHTAEAGKFEVGDKLFWQMREQTKLVKAPPIHHAKS